MKHIIDSGNRLRRAVRLVSMSKQSEKKERKRKLKELRAQEDIRKDHYVPECYQNAFTDDEGKLWVWEKANYTKRFAYMYPAQICWEDHYYEVPEELLKRFDQKDPKVIESKAFSQYEGSIQRLVDWFLMGIESISMQDFIVLCHGYLLQKQRVPFHVNGLAELAKTDGQNLTKGALQDVRTNFTQGVKNSPDYEQFKDHPNLKYFLSDEYWQTVFEHSLVMPMDWHHTQLNGLLSTATGSNPAMTNALGRLSMMQLHILGAPEGHYFLCSDNPGFSFIQNPDLPGTVATVNTNFLNNVGINFPLSSKLALYIHLGEQQDLDAPKRKVHYFDVPEQDMIAFNFDTIRWADKKVMCVDKKYMTRYVEGLKNYKP